MRDTIKLITLNEFGARRYRELRSVTPSQSPVVNRTVRAAVRSHRDLVLEAPGIDVRWIVSRSSDDPLAARSESKIRRSDPVIWGDGSERSAHAAFVAFPVRRT